METQPEAYSQDEVVMEQLTLEGRQEEAEKPSQVPEAIRLSVLQKLMLLVKGRLLVGCERRPGWSGSLPIYVFRCPRHGIQTDYNRGHYERLDCPLCGHSRWGRPPETGFEVWG